MGQKNKIKSADHGAATRGSMNTDLIGKKCPHRPAFQLQVKTFKVVDVKKMINGEGVTATFLVLDDGCEIEASSAYFPFSESDSESERIASATSPRELSIDDLKKAFYRVEITKLRLMAKYSTNKYQKAIYLLNAAKLELKL